MKITYFTLKASQKKENEYNSTALYKSLFIKRKSGQIMNQKKERELIFENLAAIIEKIKSNNQPYIAINTESIDLYSSSPISIIDCQVACDLNTIFLIMYFASIATEVGGALFVTTSTEYIYSIKPLAKAYFESNGLVMQYIDIEKRILGFIKTKKIIPFEYINNELL